MAVINTCGVLSGSPRKSCRAVTQFIIIFKCPRHLRYRGRGNKKLIKKINDYYYHYSINIADKQTDIQTYRTDDLCRSQPVGTHLRVCSVVSLYSGVQATVTSRHVLKFKIVTISLLRLVLVIWNHPCLFPITPWR